MTQNVESLILILVRNKTKMEQLWNPLAKAQFPNGLEDPDLILVKIQVNQAEDWDSDSSKIVILAKIIKAIVTGENRKMKLNIKSLTYKIEYG